jgi:hypothetical protein
VTTKHRGVFFGEQVSVDMEKGLATLKNARNCIAWSENLKGFLGLAKFGPDNNSRIGPAVGTLKLNNVTSAALCTSSAVKAWELEPWS